MDGSNQRDNNNPEVIFNTQASISLTRQEIEKLVRIAKGNSRNRVRLCVHRTKDEPLHQMLIVHPRHAYVRPHMHIEKSESIVVLDGNVDYIIFDEVGNIKERLEMGPYNSGRPFFQSAGPGIVHTLLIHSEWLVFLEITEGPFVKEGTKYAEWSPLETDYDGAADFVRSLSRKTFG